MRPRPPAFNCDTAKKFHIPSTVFPILLFPPSRRIHSFVPDYQRRHCPLSRFLAQQEGRALSALSVLLFRRYLTFCSFTFGGSGSGGTATDRQYTSCFLKQHVSPRSGLDLIQIPAAARARFRINCSILFDRLVRKITALVMQNRRLAKPDGDLLISTYASEHSISAAAFPSLLPSPADLLLPPSQCSRNLMQDCIHARMAEGKGEGHPLAAPLLA